MATFARLKARTVAEIGGYDVTNDATILGEWANDAVRDVLLRTGVYVQESTATLTANTDDETLDDEILLIKSLYVDGSSSDYLAMQVSPSELIEMRVRGASSTDGFLFYALQGSNLLRVYPTPTTNLTLNFTFVGKPTEMSLDAHDPSNATYGGIPVEFHPALLAYMFWKAASADDDSSSGQGERYRDDYERELRKVRKYVNMKGNSRLPKVPTGRRHRIPRDPSADWR